MKRIFLFFSFVLLTIFVSAQGSYTWLRHDTTLLRSDECQWLVKTPASKNKSVPQVILEAVQSGKLKAFDPQTNERIPGNKIFTWGQSSDTTLVWDAKQEKDVMKVIQHKINPERLTRIRVYQDWYLNTATGKIESWIKTVDLMAEVRSPSTGDMIGYQVTYRIQY